MNWLENVKLKVIINSYYYTAKNVKLKTINITKKFSVNLSLEEIGLILYSKYAYINKFTIIEDKIDFNVKSLWLEYFSIDIINCICSEYNKKNYHLKNWISNLIFLLVNSIITLIVLQWGLW